MHRTLLILALLLLPNFSYAAFSGLILSQKPEVPVPGSEVLITASSIDRDVMQLEFVWSVDGKKVAQAVGQTTLTVAAPQVGERMSVVVEAREQGRAYGAQELVIQPAALYLEWEGRTSVPPFYTGKRLASPQTSVVISAIPHFVYPNGARENAENIFFEWRVNGSLRYTPTLGKSSATLDLPLLNKPFFVTVTGVSRDGSLKGQGNIVVSPVTPEVVVYETAPLGGLLDRRAVTKALQFQGEEVTLTAYPLYASPREALTFEWLLNRSTVETEEGRSHTITFRKTGSGSGSYTVEASYRNPARFLERAAHSFLLQF